MKSRSDERILVAAAKSSISAYAANHHEVDLIPLSFDFYMIEATPDKLIGDRVYDRDPSPR